MKFAERFERAFHYLLPTPFSIAVVLTLISMLLAVLFGNISSEPSATLNLLEYWYSGIWNPPLLVFALQMMLILVLGHSLALAPPVSSGIDKIVDLARSPVRAAFLVSFFTILVAFFNWGLGLIFGAILARKTGERFHQRGQNINYPLIGAAGYAGMMVWHGGLSGSAPLKVVEEGHLHKLMAASWSAERLDSLPAAITLESTIFSNMNLVAGIAVLLILPLALAWLMKRSSSTSVRITGHPVKIETDTTGLRGAERLDYSRVFCLLFAALILGYVISVAWLSEDFSFISLNYLNFFIFGLGLLFHGSIASFTKAVEQAIKGAAGILIQFPLYFGIMGIMASTGLIEQISGFFIQISNPTTFRIFTFLSAGLVNIFVPSGGGQWAVQGPIVIEAAYKLGVDLPKSIMALAYGDQLTNMLQPFWALPLLGITGLKAREILPYTLFLMALGAIIYIGILLVF